MKIKALALVLALCLALPGAALAKKPKYFWKNATLAPDGIGWAKHMKDLIFPEMEKTTQGDLKVKVYWGGVMGDEKDYIKKMRIGQLQGAGLSAQGTVMACPEMAVVELPFLFNNYPEVDYVRIKMEGAFDRIMEKQGFFLIGWIDQDFDQIFSSKYPMADLEDFRKSRFITWYGPLEQIMFQDLGADAFPVAVPELAAAGRQGVADAAIGPAVWVVGAQLYTKLKFINPVKIRYSPATIILTMESWKSLPQEYRDEFYEKRLILGWRYCNLVRRDNKKFVRSLIDYGVKETKMTPRNLDALKTTTHKVWGQVTGDLFPQSLLDEVQNYLAEYRAGKRLTIDDLLKMTRYKDVSQVPPQRLEQFKEDIRKNMKEFGIGDNELVKLD